MGGLGAGYKSAYYINFANPASYSNLVLTTFETGIYGQGGKITSDSTNYSSGGGNINHFALGFPIRNKREIPTGISFGLLPYSNVKYNFQNSINHSELGTYQQDISGKGSFYQAYIGSGMRFNDVSFGLNTIFIFGKNDYLLGTSFADSLGLLDSRNHKEMNVRGVTFNMGLQYDIKIQELERRDAKKDPINLTIGVTGSPGIKMKTNVSDFWETTRTNIINTTIVVDTAAGGLFNEKGSLKLPWSVGLGATIGNEKNWLAGIDFKYGAWEKSNIPLSTNNLKNRWEVGFGGQISPQDNKGKYYERMDFRLGFHTGMLEQTVDNQQVFDFGTTFGFSLPMKRSFSKINLGTDIGKMSVSDLKQTYYKFTISYTLSDRWFIKRKYD